jgi:hypothetical protein
MSCLPILIFSRLSWEFYLSALAATILLFQIGKMIGRKKEKRGREIDDLVQGRTLTKQ